VDLGFRITAVSFFGLDLRGQLAAIPDDLAYKLIEENSHTDFVLLAACMVTGINAGGKPRVHLGGPNPTLPTAAHWGRAVRALPFLLTLYRMERDGNIEVQNWPPSLRAALDASTPGDYLGMEVAPTVTSAERFAELKRGGCVSLIYGGGDAE
jgi:hypothetical protein